MNDIVASLRTPRGCFPAARNITLISAAPLKLHQPYTTDRYSLGRVFTCGEGRATQIEVSWQIGLNRLLFQGSNPLALAVAQHGPGDFPMPIMTM